MTIQESQISDNTVRKIQLLLKLAERTEGNEAEAAAAMGKAQELLAQYNLDLATVQDKIVEGGTNTPDNAMAKRGYARIRRSAMYKWQRELVKNLAEANYCRYWVVEVAEGRRGEASNVKRHKVLGRVANTTAVLVMADYLFDAIERLLPYANKERLSRSANSWREGCADRLIERIQAKAEEMRTADYATQGEAAYSTAIAIRNVVTAEEIGNYDHINGVGAWAQREAEKAKYEAERPEREARWAKQREEREAKELAELEAKLLAETPEQKIKRLRKEAREAERSANYSARYWAREDRKAEREEARRDHSAYAAGGRTAEKIGLDNQISKGKDTGRLR